MAIGATGMVMGVTGMISDAFTELLLRLARGSKTAIMSKAKKVIFCVPVNFFI